MAKIFLNLLKSCYGQAEFYGKYLRGIFTVCDWNIALFDLKSDSNDKYLAWMMWNRWKSCCGQVKIYVENFKCLKWNLGLYVYCEIWKQLLKFGFDGLKSKRKNGQLDWYFAETEKVLQKQQLLLKHCEFVINKLLEVCIGHCNILSYSWNFFESEKSVFWDLLK